MADIMDNVMEAALGILVTIFVAQLINEMLNEAGFSGITATVTSWIVPLVVIFAVVAYVRQLY